MNLENKMGEIERERKRERERERERERDVKKELDLDTCLVYKRRKSNSSIPVLHIGGLYDAQET